MTMPPAFYGNLVGVNFRPADVRALIHDQIQVGMDVRLEREPDNSYDENAVKVHCSFPTYEAGSRTTADEEFFVGYIERGVAAKLARWLDEGYVMAARIHSRIDSKQTPWLIEVKPTGEQRRMPKVEVPNHVRDTGDLFEDDIPF